jgi:DNA repair exonuclease SbcCD ATPase subunit
MICFKIIRWKNLLSTGNTFTEVQLDLNPTTLILGTNGSGKSTMLDALCYGLFKKPFRNINKDQLINTINGGECVIEVEFEVGTRQYKIVRGIKPDIFDLYVDGKKRELHEAATKDDQAYLIEDILKVNFESFTQVVILGNARYTPFMQLKTAKRREFIEHILDIGVFSTMNEILSARQKNTKTEMDTISKDMLVVREQITLVQGFIAKLTAEASKANDEIVEKIEQGNNSINDLIQDVDDITAQIETLSETIEDSDSVVERIQALTDTERKLQSNITNAQSKINFYTDNETCKTCTQPIQEAHRTTIITEKETLIAKFQKGILVVSQDRQKLQTRLSEIKTVSKQIQALNVQVQEKTNNIRAIRTYVKKLESDMQKKPGNVKEHEDKLATYEQKIIRLEKQKQECVERRHFYDVASVLLKDTGIKAAIIKQYLPAINRLVNKYLGDLDFFLSFSLDESFNETFKSRHRDTLSYYSFSEGEKLRIDLALLFAWREIARMKNSCSTNLLILDEVIDSSLDNDGTDYVIKMFNDLGKQANVMVISHKNDSALDMFTNVLRFEKVANFSRVVSS